jgi:hypothetical protein
MERRKHNIVAPVALSGLAAGLLGKIPYLRQEAPKLDLKCPTLFIREMWKVQRRLLDGVLST